MLETLINSISDNVLEIVITIISLIVSYYIIPAIKEDLVPWLKELRIYSTVKKFVQAAEKLADAGTIQKIDKNDYVVSLLEKNGIVVDDTLKAFIESAVIELDKIIDVTEYEILMDENDTEK